MRLVKCAHLAPLFLLVLVFVSCSTKDDSTNSHTNNPLSGDTVPGFEFIKEETFSCGGLTNSVKIYRHKKTGLEFVRVPMENLQQAKMKNSKGRETKDRARLEPFLICRTEVTQSVWTKIMGTTPWTNQLYLKEDANCPAAYISWNDCASFCAITGLRLPTEAEWEYACRAGSSTIYCFGDSAAELGDYAWFDGNADKKGDQYAHPVASKKPNAFGLFDVHGNVYEWCHDIFKSNSSLRARRGGCWDRNAVACGSAIRDRRHAHYVSSFLGFRPCRPIANPQHDLKDK